MKKSAAIIGTGRVGSALARGLSEAGYRAKYLASKPSVDAQKLAIELHCQHIEAPYSELKDSDIIFLTVPDRQIESVAMELAGSAVIGWEGKTVIHTSGALTSEILLPLKTRGAETISLHPLQTFPPGSKSARFRNIYFSIEGDNTTAAESIARDLGGTPFRIKSEHKQLYHAAATIASNYMFALISTAVRTLKLSGIEEEKIDPLKVLFPLIKGTFDSIEEYGLKEGLTGPVARGDIETIERHLDELRQYPELLSVYKVMGSELLKLTDLDTDLKEKIKTLFNG